MSETSEVTRPVIDAINALPECFAYRVHSGKVKVRGGWMQLAPKGTPDLFAMVRGVAVHFETKVERGRLSAEQREMHAHLRRAGARVEVVRSVAEAMTVVRQVMEANG